MPDTDPGLIPVSRSSSNSGHTPTEDIASVNGGLKNKKEIRISLSVLIGIIGTLIGAASFSANYLFATKAEIGDAKIEILNKQSQDASRIHEVKTEITEVRGDLKAVKRDVEHIMTTQNEYRAEQRVIDENLRRLLRKERVRPLPKAK